MSSLNSIRLIALVLSFMTLVQSQTKAVEDFRSTFRNELKQAGIAGGSFVLLRDGQTVAEEHYGVANVAKSQSINADTIYHWASNTKPFTGIAIMQLRDRGLLNSTIR